MHEVCTRKEFVLWSCVRPSCLFLTQHSGIHWLLYVLIWTLWIRCKSAVSSLSLNRSVFSELVIGEGGLHCTLRTAHSTLHTAHYSLHTVHFTLCTAHRTLRTAVTFQAFVSFNFAFSTHTKPSPVSTDHYFSCFVFLTHRLPCWIMLLLRYGRKFWWLFNFLQYRNKLLFQNRFHCAIQSIVIVLLYSKEYCSKWKKLSNICSYFLQWQSHFLV